LRQTIKIINTQNLKNTRVKYIPSLLLYAYI
jgi:hypothetical protein